MEFFNFESGRGEQDELYMSQSQDMDDISALDKYVLRIIASFMSPPLLMHAGLIHIAFCLSLDVGPKFTVQKITRQKFISQEV